MRATRRRRQRKREIALPPAGTDLVELAGGVSYEGSPEHKDVRSFLGQPRPRADASICERQLADDLNRVTEWLREAIRRGAVGSPWEGRYPRYVWYKDAEVVYEGRLINHEQGTYKGYPLNRDEWPLRLTECYE
jgi:hypothetical protein